MGKRHHPTMSEEELQRWDGIVRHEMRGGLFSMGEPMRRLIAEVRRLRKPDAVAHQVARDAYERERALRARIAEQRSELDDAARHTIAQNKQISALRTQLATAHMCAESNNELWKTAESERAAAIENSNELFDQLATAREALEEVATFADRYGIPVDTEKGALTHRLCREARAALAKLDGHILHKGQDDG